MKTYHVYITTKQHKTVLYTGVTNDLPRRLNEHLSDALYTGKGFTGKNQCFYLLYSECFSDINMAIAREKEIKGWRKSKKIDLIKAVNPDLNFLNENTF
jgi:putative endonuclease